MNTELQEKIRKYQEDLLKEIKKLEDEKKELETERKEIMDKFTNGENLSRKDRNRNQELAQEIKEIQEEIDDIKSELKQFDELKDFELFKKSLTTLANNKTTKKDKDAIIKAIVKKFTDLNKEVEEDFVNSGVLTEEQLKDIPKTKKELLKNKKDLNKAINVNKANGTDTTSLEEKLEEIDNTLKQIKEYEKLQIDITELENDLNKLANNNTSKADKDAIIEKYSKIIDKYMEVCAENIEKIINNPERESDTEELEPENRRTSNKKLLDKLTEKLKKSGKTIAKVTGVVVLSAAMIYVFKSCSKTANRNTSTNNTEIEQNHNNSNKQYINDLTKKGYSEYAAVLMAKNFKEDTIKAILATPHNPAIENYVTSKDFNVDYITQYETARTIYNLEPEKAVDYVNRSVKIQATGFYNDATINQIVEVVMAIDKKELFMADNNALEHSINATLTDIYNNYAFTTGSINDLNKIDALAYFAKDGSDLDMFLTEYSAIVKTILSSRNDTETSEKAKASMYTYLDTFANTFAGNTIGDDVTAQENFAKAVVNDTYDWNMAYSSFIKPLMSMFITENNINDYICLQTNLLSNYEQWAKVNCDYGQSRTLGGE